MDTLQCKIKCNTISEEILKSGTVASRTTKPGSTGMGVNMHIRLPIISESITYRVYANKMQDLISARKFAF